MTWHFPKRSQLPVVCADPYLNKLLIKYCDEARSHRKSGHCTYRVAVENAIVPCRTKARVDKIARQLGMNCVRSNVDWVEGLTFTGILSELVRSPSAICGKKICRFPRSRGCSATRTSAGSRTHSNAGPERRQEKPEGRRMLRGLIP
jgi:hypothetical protein